MIDLFNIILKNIFLNIWSIIIFFRLSNYRDNKGMKKVAILVLIVVLSIFYIFLKYKIDIVMAIFVIYLLQVVILKITTRRKILNLLIGLIVSMSITYLYFIISVAIEYLIQKIFGINNKIINIIITFIIESILLYFFLKIRRLKNGLTFFQRTNDYIEIIFINISVFIILLYGLLGYSDKRVFEHLLFYLIVLVIFMIITIQKILTMYYKQKLIDDTINDYKKELEEKNSEIESLKDEAFKVSKINHEFYNRQKSLEMMVKNAIENSDMETGEELTILERINDVTKEHSEKMKDIKSLSELPLTDIPEIDDMFKYMQKECFKNDIQFKLNIEGNMFPLVNNIISKHKLETLMGDHIRDAIIAVNFADCSNKEIFVILGIRDECYEFCVYDTGIEFEIDTLLKLGLMPITTHKDSGGSGIGFMTTFETLKECKASLIIEELHHVGDNNYTKAVKIRFDGKNEYRISSYRFEQFQDKKKDNRIIIEK